MKKTMFAVLCLAMTTLTCVANNHKPAKHHDNRPRQERVDPVINMDVVSEMGLSDKQVKKIEELKEKKHEEMKALRPKKQHDGKPMAQRQERKKMDREQMQAQRTERQQMQKAHRAEHKAKVQAINEKYRKELQDIMGTKNYVTYVEKVNDKLAMRSNFQGRQHKMKMHKMPRRQHMHQQHPRMHHDDMQQNAEKA